MTNSERTTNGPWVIRRSIDPDKMAIIYSIPGEGREVLATETRADLEALRDALIEHLAPAGQMHDAIFNLKTFNGAMGWANLHVRIAGSAPTAEEVNEMSKAAAKHFGASSAILVNLIPLAGA